MDDDHRLRVEPTPRERLKVPRPDPKPPLKVRPTPKSVLKVRKPGKAPNGKTILGAITSFNCPHCQTEIKEGEHYYECPDCHSRNHQGCWEAGGGCGGLASHAG